MVCICTGMYSICSWQYINNTLVICVQYVSIHSGMYWVHSRHVSIHTINTHSNVYRYTYQCRVVVFVCIGTYHAPICACTPLMMAPWWWQYPDHCSRLGLLLRSRSILLRSWNCAQSEDVAQQPGPSASQKQAQAAGPGAQMLQARDHWHYADFLLSVAVTFLFSLWI